MQRCDRILQEIDADRTQTSACATAGPSTGVNNTVKTHVHRVKDEQTLGLVVVVVTFVVCGVHLELGESNQHGRLDRGTRLQDIGTFVVVFEHVHAGVVAVDFSIVMGSRRITA